MTNKLEGSRIDRLGGGSIYTKYLRISTGKLYVLRYLVMQLNSGRLDTGMAILWRKNDK